ncbi:MAG: hypothetical protein WCG55_00815 [bacterium]
MQFSIEQFNQMKHSAEDFYNSIDKIRCPYFAEDVHFNAKGLEHLIFKGYNKTRPIEDQFSRFRHLKLASAIIQNSKTLQGYWRTQKIERIRRNQKWEKVLRVVSYYEFIAVMDSHDSKVRVKVVVKQVEGSEKHFLSIIPFWGSDKNTGERIIHSGNPEKD